MSTELEWKFRIDCNGTATWEAGTQKWYYSIMCQCNETGTAGFEASRKSTNDGLAHEGIGDLEAKCASLQEAQAAIAVWHQYRYGDSDVEFADYGGNTAEAWDADTKDWSGKFTCKTCGEPIADAYTIQGILHHESEHECEECRQEWPVFRKKGKDVGDFSNS